MKLIVQPLPRVAGRRCELSRLLDLRQRARRARPEATEGEHRERPRAQGVVVERFGQLERR